MNIGYTSNFHYHKNMAEIGFRALGLPLGFIPGGTKDICDATHQCPVCGPRTAKRAYSWHLQNQCSVCGPSSWMTIHKQFVENWTKVVWSHMNYDPLLTSTKAVETKQCAWPHFDQNICCGKYNSNTTCTKKIPKIYPNTHTSVAPTHTYVCMCVWVSFGYIFLCMHCFPKYKHWPVMTKMGPWSPLLTLLSRLYGCKSKSNGGWISSCIAIIQPKLANHLFTA